MTHWATPNDLTRALRRRWDRGELLARVSSGAPWEPIRLPISGPTARELSTDFGSVRDWAAAWQRAAGPERSPRVRLGTRRVGGRLVGANAVPCEAWFERPEQVWRWLGVGDEVTAYQTMLASALEGDPRLGAWVAAYPMRALAQAGHWDALQRSVLWLRDWAGRDAYLREVDVPGVDTKFLEARSRLVTELLDAVRASEPALDGATDLVGAFGLSDKPKRIRLRAADGASLLAAVPGLSDLTVRVDELAWVEVGAGPVLVVENEVSFLALPPLPGVVAFFGSGFDVLRLGRLPWLCSGLRPVVYWGDLDTHGFVILDRLRGMLPSVRSVLMDETTLLAHRSQWVSEPRPSREVLTRLTEAEATVYAELVGDVHGPGVRLEQERVERGWAAEALSSTLEDVDGPVPKGGRPAPVAR